MKTESTKEDHVAINYKINSKSLDPERVNNFKSGFYSVLLDRNSGNSFVDGSIEKGKWSSKLS